MDEIFNHWPSLAKFAEDVGVPAFKARQWKQRRSIPARYDLRIIAVAKNREFPITLELLARLRAVEAGLAPTSAADNSGPAR